MNVSRRVIAGVAATGVVLSLVACSSGETGTSAGEGGDGGKDDTISVLLNGNGIGTKLKALVAEYVKDTGRKVNLQVLAEQQMRDKEQLNLQSKSTGMDVYMTLPSREGPLFSQSGYYEPLDGYLSKADKDYNADGFAEAAINGMKIDGKIVAMPMNIEGPVLYYRKDILEKSGLAVPKTVDDLMSAVKKIAADGDDSYVPITLRGQADAIAYDFGPIFHATGLDWTTKGEPNFDKPKAVEAIDQYATLAKKYGPKGVINYSFNESTNLFAAGGAAFELESSNLLPTIVNPSTSKVVDKTGVATVPGGVPAVLSWGLAISPFSKHKTAAWEFVQWATSKDVQLNMALQGIAPPRSAIFDDPKYSASLNDAALKEEWRDAIVEISKHGNPEIGPVGQQAPAIRKVIGDAIGTVILGQATAKEAAASIQDQLVPLLADQRK